MFLNQIECLKAEGGKRGKAAAEASHQKKWQGIFPLFHLPQPGGKCPKREVFEADEK
jgi:hypothetical protein